MRGFFVTKIMYNLQSVFKKIVSIPSTSGNENMMADFLLNYFIKRNIEVEMDTIGNVFAKVPGIGESVFVSAHMDTVEPGRGVVPRFENGIFTSSGDTVLGADNKATIAVILNVIDSLDNKSHRPLEILFTVDEENENKGAKNFNYSQLRSKKGLIADVSLPIGTIILGSPSYLRFDLEFSSKNAHAAFPEKAQSILTLLEIFFSKIKTGLINDNILLNIGFGKFGDSRNTIPGNALISGEIRSFDELQMKKYYHSLVAQVKDLTKKYQCKVLVQSAIDNPAYEFDKQDNYVIEIKNIFLKLGIQPTFKRDWSVSDANIFNDMGLHVINIGDGTKNTHTVNETTSLQNLENLTQIFQMYCQK